jgi:hypothetical protein
MANVIGFDAIFDLSFLFSYIVAGAPQWHMDGMRAPIIRHQASPVCLHRRSEAGERC